MEKSDEAAHFAAPLGRVCTSPSVDEEWFEVGLVSIAADSSTTAEQAAQLQTRLILEHGVKLQPMWQQQIETLECGLGEAISTDSDDTDGDSAASAQLIERRSLISTQPSLAATCGFLGAPDPNAGHYWSGSVVDDNGASERKVKLAKLGNDAKSAVAERDSKNLGLRSG